MGPTRLVRCTGTSILSLLPFLATHLPINEVFLVPEGACKDLGRPDQCQVRGKCITGNMLTNCMKSCGTCPTIPAPKEKGMLICADARSGSTCPAYGIQEGCDRGDCYKRSEGGECGSNPNYMLRYCQFSCKLCDQITN